MFHLTPIAMNLYGMYQSLQAPRRLRVLKHRYDLHILVFNEAIWMGDQLDHSLHKSQPTSVLTELHVQDNPFDESCNAHSLGRL